MDIQKSLQDAWEVLLLKEPRLNSLAKDRNALQSALVIFAAASFVAAFGRMFFPSVMGMVTYRSGLYDVLFEAAISIGVGIGMLYLAGYLAERLFHSKLDTQGYVTIMGHAGLVNVLGLIPALSAISGLWTLIVMCVVLNKLGHLQAGSIVLLILLEALLMAVLIGGVVLFGVGAGMSSMMF